MLTKYLNWVRLRFFRLDYPEPKLAELNRQEFAADRDDPVLAMIRAMSQHENTIKRVEYDPEQGSICLTLDQLNESGIRPERFRLKLTFLEVDSFAIASANQTTCQATTVQHLHCDRMATNYGLAVILNNGNEMISVVRITFGQLRYDRAPLYG